MCKVFKHLQGHPNANGISIFFTIVSSVMAALALAWAVFTYIRPPTMIDALGSSDITKNTSSEHASSTKRETRKYIGSIFDLTKEILNEPITIKKEAMYQANVGLQVQDSGYVLDIKDIPDGQYSGDIYKIAVDLSSTNSDRSTSVQCLFTESWRQTMLGNLLNKKIQFKGTINGEKNYDAIVASNKNVPLLVLTDCSISQ